MPDQLDGLRFHVYTWDCYPFADATYVRPEVSSRAEAVEALKLYANHVGCGVHLERDLSRRWIGRLVK